LKLTLGQHTLVFGRRPLIMGILNVTPDSFWDGGRYTEAPRALERAEELLEEGADIIDVGGESTRPGSGGIDADEEIARVRPVIEAIVRRLDVAVSIDTRKAEVARRMLDTGAHMVNDVSGLAFDEEMTDVVRDHDVPVVVMHMRGTPDTMQSHTDYGDVVTDVRDELARMVRAAEEAGIDPEKIVVDPGIGFAKTADQCVELLARLDEFSELGKPVLIGPSRKSFMGKIPGLEPGRRLEATLACCLSAARKGASIVRVHDVGPVSRALRMFEEIAKRETAIGTGARN
jgi:dihydropteroate synthase